MTSPANSDLNFSSRPWVPKEYPYLVIKHLEAVYQIEEISIQKGPRSLQLGRKRCKLQHPQPFNPAGELSSEARRLLVRNLSEVTRALRRDICIVWSKNHCSYLSQDGDIGESSDLPSGGMYLGSDILDNVVIPGGLSDDH